MSDIAEEFPSQLVAIKRILYSWFKAEFEKVPEERDRAGLVAAQVVNYLTGEDLTSIPIEVEDDEVKAAILAVRPAIPKAADDIMRQDQGLREIIVETLRMRLILNAHYRFEEMVESGLEQRISDLLQVYGNEFTDHELTPRRYRALVANVMNWALSEQFPGREPSR